MANSTSICPECGAVRRAGALRGLCPRCMMRVTLHEPAENEAVVEPEEYEGSEVGQRFGDYLLLREIGRGGMGVVYEARELSLQRIVALKMLLPARLASAAQLERFRLEAEAIAALDHPNLLPVYASGRQAGQPFFTMKRAEGGSLAARLTTGQPPLSPRDAARIVSAVARAVHYAHQRGIHHRDLKPANILLDAAGQPYVSDFGLAKFREHEAQLTLSAEMFGSPAYMAPEQASGDMRRVTSSADIYSLGAVLYELLAGRVPFTADSTPALLRRIVEDEPARPRTLRTGIPADLEVICLKCLQKEPEKRPPTAEFLAEELDRWARGEPILSRPVPVAEKCWRWAKRRPALASALGALALTFAVGTGAAGLQWRRAAELSRQQQLERYAADLQVASQALASHDLGLARRMVAAQIPGPNEEDLRGVEWRVLAKLTEGQERLMLKGHTATVTSVAALAKSGRVVSGAMDGTLRIWDSDTGACITNVLAHSPVVWSVAVTPEDEIVSAGADGFVRFWTSAGTPMRSPIPGVNAALSADGALLAVSASSPFKFLPGRPGLSLWNWRTHEELFQTNLVVRRVALSPDGSLLAAAVDEGILLYNRKSGEARILAAEIPWALDFSPDGQRLAAAGFNLGAAIWNLGAISEPRRLMGHNYKMWSVAFSPTGRQVATTGSDRTLRIRDLDSAADPAVMEGHDDEIWAVAWIGSRHSLATASKDTTVRIWPDRPKPRTIEVPNLGYCRPSFSADGKRFLTRALNAKGVNVLTVRSVETGEPQAQFEGRWAGAFAPDGTDVLLVNDGNATLERWDARTGTTGRAVPLANAPPGAKAADYLFARDGSALVAIHLDGAYVWRTSDGAQLAGKLPLPGQGGVAGAICRGGRRVALSCETPYTIALYDLETKNRILLTNHTEIVKGLDFSPDGRLLASASVDRFVRVWDAASGRLAAELVRHVEEASDVAFSGDGRCLVSIGITQAVKFWHLPTFREVLSLDIPDAGERVAFSPQNNAIAFTSSHDTVRLLSIGEDRPAK